MSSVDSSGSLSFSDLSLPLLPEAPVLSNIFFYCGFCCVFRVSILCRSVSYKLHMNVACLPCEFWRVIASCLESWKASHNSAIYKWASRFLGATEGVPSAYISLRMFSRIPDGGTCARGSPVPANVNTLYKDTDTHVHMSHLRFSQRSVWRLPSSGMWRYVIQHTFFNHCFLS
jgi:hypothetical protein